MRIAPYKMIYARHPEDQSRLEEIYLRYAIARKPGKGKKHDGAYRLRNLFMDRWNLWPRLTFYRSWKDEYGITGIRSTIIPSNMPAYSLFTNFGTITCDRAIR